MNTDMTYIVTGCTGYVGNAITKKLMSYGCSVVGFARDEEKFKRVFGDDCPDVVFGDICDEDALKRLFVGEGPFVVIHTVAYVSIGEGDEKELYRVTVGGTEAMLKVAMEHNTEKFLHVSSSEAIPEKMKLDPEMKNYIPTPERTRKGYNRAKSTADAMVLSAVKEKGLNASLIMPAGVLGPGDYSNTHMTQLMIDFVEGRIPASIDGGYNDFDIRDLTDVLDKIIERSEAGETYIFANQPDKINEVLSYVSEATGAKMRPTLPMWIAYVGLPFLYLGSLITGKRPLYTLSSLASLRADTDFPLDKSKRVFGYSPRPLRKTVMDHIEFLKENGILKI